MVKMLAIAGTTKSGKTRLITRLVDVFIARCLRVAVLQRSHFQIARATSCTAPSRFTDAG